MADATVLFDEEVADTLATDTTWVDMALIPAASFEASTEYIVIAVASARHASAAQETRARLCHGATPTILTDASVAWEGLNLSQRHQVQWLRRFTQPGTTEDLKIQLSSSSTTDVTNDYSAILAFKAADLGTEDTHWFWNEDTADYTGTSTPTAKASETFTPNGTDRWLIVGEATWDPTGNTAQIGFELHDGTSVLSSMSQEAEDTTNDVLAQMLVWTGAPSNSSKTYSVRPFGSQGSFLSNRIFALNLERFAQASTQFSAAEVALAASPSWTNLATRSLTPSTSGDFVIIGTVVSDVGNTGDDFDYRLQVDDGGGLASDPAYGDDAPGIDNWDATDETTWTFLKKRSLTSGASRTINFDGSMVAGTTMRAEDRALVVFSVLLAAGGAVSVSPANASIVITGQTPIARIDNRVSPTVASVTVTGQTPTVSLGERLSPAAASVAVTGQTSTIVIDNRVLPAAASVAVTGQTPTVTASDHQVVSPAAASVSVTGDTPSVVVGVSVAPSAADIAVTGQTSTIAISDHQTVSPAAADIVVTGDTPTVTASDHQTVSPTAATIAVTGDTSTVVATDNQFVSPSTATVEVTGQTSTVAVSDHQAVSPAAAAIAITGSTPTIATGDDIVLTPTPASIALTAFAPDIVITEHIRVSPTPASVAITAFAPDVLVTENQTVFPSAAAITMTGTTPGVFIGDVPLPLPAKARIDATASPTAIGIVVDDGPDIEVTL